MPKCLLHNLHVLLYGRLLCEPSAYPHFVYDVHRANLRRRTDLGLPNHKVCVYEFPTHSTAIRSSCYQDSNHIYIYNIYVYIYPNNCTFLHKLIFTRAHKPHRVCSNLACMHDGREGTSQHIRPHTVGIMYIFIYALVCVLYV